MITWKLPGYEKAVDSKEGSNASGLLLADGQMGSQDGLQSLHNAESGRNQDDDLFGKNVGGAGTGNESLDHSRKVDERTSLLPDGTNKNVNSLGSDGNPKGEDGSGEENPDD